MPIRVQGSSISLDLVEFQDDPKAKHWKEKATG